MTYCRILFTLFSAAGTTPIKPAKKKVTELECGEVRWFYLKPGETKWTPFKGKQSKRHLKSIPIVQVTTH